MMGEGDSRKKKTAVAKGRCPYRRNHNIIDLLRSKQIINPDRLSVGVVFL